MIGSCGGPEPGLMLTNGCYYASGRPIVRIKGNDGVVLVPGEVQTVRVSRRSDPAASMAIFAPGFYLESRSDIRAVRQRQFPRYHYMMSPGSGVPTILMPTVSEEIVPLSLGPPC